MYIAINKKDDTDFHSFTWSETDKLIINGKEVDPNDYDIIEVAPVK